MKIGNLEERQIAVKNIRTNYKVYGEGHPFLILHGWGSSSDRWEKVAELLATHFMVIIPDLPGFGKSQPLDKPWNMNDYVGWLREFVKQVPELGSHFYLLGHSFGGSLAAKFSLQYIQSVEKLFLVAAAAVRERTFKQKVFYGAAKMAKPLRFLPGYRKFREVAYHRIIKSDYAEQESVMKETYLNVIQENLLHKLSFIKVPTIIIWGDKDDYTPIAQAHLINQKIKGSTLVVIPGADHLLNSKAPDLLAQKIMENS